MMRLTEILAFGGSALAIHVAVFAGVSGEGGAPVSAGDAGASALTLAALAPSERGVVAAWERPPEVPQVSNTGLSAPRADLAAPALSAMRDRAPDLPAPDRLAALSFDAPVAPGAAPEPPASAAETGPRPLPRPAEIAAGRGGAGARGVAQSTPAATPGLSETRRTHLIASWGGEIRAAIERSKQSPRSAASGRPVVRITVARDGALVSAELLKSSHVAALDRAALEAVTRAGRLPAAPGEFDRPRMRFDLPIAFTR